VREEEVPVKVMEGAAEAAVIAAVSVMVADNCAGVRVRVDGLAVTPDGSPETETEIEPLKELSEAAVTVMALLVVPALRESEPGETAREKSGVGLGEEPPQVVRRERVARAATRPSVLARVRMSGRSSAGLTVSHDETASVIGVSFVRTSLHLPVMAIRQAGWHA
jgi:hypothetical protein